MNTGFWRSKRVLVTGHTGFKGSWLCMILETLGARVVGYALAPPTRPSLFELARIDESVESTLGDVRDLKGVHDCLIRSNPDVVIHMAAQSVVLDSYADPVTTYATNVMGTVNVLEAVRASGRPVTIVNVTTDKCYENRQWPWPYRESDRLGGEDPYSNSKACSELVTMAYRHSFFPLAEIQRHGVAIASARAGNVIGGGDWTPHQLVPAIVAAFERNEPVALRYPSAVRPWQHVLDCLSGYLALAEALSGDAGGFGGEWNFGPSSDDVYRVGDVADALAKRWNVQPAWKQASGDFLPEALELRLDSSKARRLLGWQPRLMTAVALDWVGAWYLRTRSGEPARKVCRDQIAAYFALPVRASATAADGARI